MQSDSSEVLSPVVAPKYDYSCYTVVYSEEQLKKAVEDARKDYEACHNTKIEGLQTAFKAALDDARVVNQALDDTCKVYQHRLSKYSDTVEELVNKSSELTEQLAERAEECQKLVIENERLNLMIQLMLKTEKALKERNKKISNAFKDSNKACRAMEDVIAGLDSRLEALSLNVETARSLALASDPPVAKLELEAILPRGETVGEERAGAEDRFALERDSMLQTIKDLEESNYELQYAVEKSHENNRYHSMVINGLEAALEDSRKELKLAIETNERLVQANKSLRLDTKKVKKDVKNDILAQVEQKLVQCQEFAVVAEEFLNECKPYIRLEQENRRVCQAMTGLRKHLIDCSKDAPMSICFDEQVCKTQLVQAVNDNHFLTECLKTQQVFTQKAMAGWIEPYYKRCLELETELQKKTDAYTERDVKVRKLLLKIETLKEELKVKTDALALSHSKLNQRGIENSKERETVSTLKKEITALKLQLETKSTAGIQGLESVLA